jgi:molybdopterin/thiamine biosynthesis adenylyltransferase
MDPQIEQWISERRQTYLDPAGREIAVLDDAAAQAAANQAGCSLGTVYRTALAQNVWPLRYVRNHDSLSIEAQYRLATAAVAVIGAGGLGGTVILLLARMGIGSLTVVDSDRFDETNLNRQALSTTASIGRSKSEAAADMVRQINAAVEVRTFQTVFNTQNAAKILEKVDVTVDALDNIPDRLVLGKEARKRGIPMIHGAIAGFEGQVITIFPEDPGLESLYGENVRRSDPQRPEAVLGVPTVTPAMIAGLQAMEVVKVLLLRGQPLRKTMLHVDLEHGRFDAFQL